MAYFPATALPATARIDDLPAGQYRIRWFDCMTGSLISDQQQTTDDALTLTLPGGEVFLYIS